MNITKSVVVLLSLPAILAGCNANPQKVACTGENWEKMGYDYASKGKSVRLFDEYRDQCGESLEDGAMNAYLDGYTKGLVEHCTYEQGYDKGVNGKQPFKTCPMEMRTAYLKGYEEGQAVLGRNLDTMKDEMRRSERYFEDESLRDRQSAQSEAERSGRSGL